MNCELYQRLNARKRKVENLFVFSRRENNKRNRIEMVEMKVFADVDRFQCIYAMNGIQHSVQLRIGGPDRIQFSFRNEISNYLFNFCLAFFRAA